MCWSADTSAAMVVVGTVATGVAYARKERAPIWIALAYFTFMEALQLAGYAVLDQCGTPGNRAVTVASYLHIAFQPIVINLFALELVPEAVRRQARRPALALAGLASAIIVVQLLPIDALGSCTPGSALCGAELCTVSGDWHIAWEVPYNGLMVPLERAIGTQSGFPAYILAVFVLPLVYGAWRFTLLHLVSGPLLAISLTDNPNEMPAVWCAFSILILLVSLNATFRRTASATTWWGLRV